MTEEPVAARDRERPSTGPGSSLGPYVIERQIGRGGMSTVFEAKHVPLDRTVALKVLRPELAGDQEFVSRFLVEARAAARLDYPHIVPVYDCGEIGGVNYISMKLLEGHDLKEVLDLRRRAGQPGLPLDRAIAIANQAAGALEYAHRHQVVHRDVKPGNIYVDDHDRVTLVDFGIARALDYSSATLTGTIMGTPTYMSPEQAQGRPADNRSDVYSLGVVLYEMLAGAPPFTGQPQAVMRAHVVADPPSLVERRSDIPVDIEAIVRRALAKDPAQRFQTAAALQQALTGAAGGTLAPAADDDGEPTLALPGRPGAVPGELSGPRTSVPLGATRSAMTPETGLAVGARHRRYLPQLAAACGAVLAAGLGGWLFLAGPLAADGRLSISTDPPGATVTVDGNGLGTTPLAAQGLRPGTHQIVVSEPTYLEVKRTEKTSSRQTDALHFSLAPLPASEVLVQKQVIVASDITVTNGVIQYGAPLTTVGVDQRFGLIVTLAQKQGSVRDVSFHYDIKLLDASGQVLADGGSVAATITKDDTSGQHFTFPDLSFHADAPAGPYRLTFFVDSEPFVTAPITLTK